MLSFIPAALLALVLSFGVSKEDVRRLIEAGVSEQTIVDYIRRNAPAEPLSVEDVTELKAVGATDAVLSAMLNASRTSDAVAPSASSSDSYSSGSTTYYGSYPSTSYYYSYPSYSYAYPYYYPYYSTPYYYPYSSSYYRPYYRYPYYHNHYNNYYYGRTVPHSVGPYRNPQTVRPQTVRPQPVRPQQTMPAQPRHGTGVPRR